MAPKRATRSTPVTTTPAPTATTTTSVTNAQLQAMIDQGVTAALAARDANRNGDDSHTSGTGGRRTERVVRECTYQDFMKCKPLYFKGTEGVVELTQWFERMETVFRISNCSVENQIKFSTCTLLAGALTWWNSHVLTVSHDVAYAMTWADLRKKMTDKYCPRNEMKKLEAELWNLKIERTVGAINDMIHGNIIASKPKTMQEAVEMATELMDKKVSTIYNTLCFRVIDDVDKSAMLHLIDSRDALFEIYLALLTQDSVMSDSDESGITYTEVSSLYKDLSDIGSPRADGHEFLELPYVPEDPYDTDEEDEDDEMDVKVDEEEEEHPAPAYPVVVALPATALSVEETEPFETDESAATPPP
ncbi:reverse transcriptase domain-containing protein, partial [Tanacetum coccineum]